MRQRLLAIVAMTLAAWVPLACGDDDGGGKNASLQTPLEEQELAPAEEELTAADLKIADSTLIHQSEQTAATTT
jgi:hypothetical protein